MDICSAYQIINSSVLKVAKSVNVLTVPVEEEEVEFIRLEESPIKISEEIKRHTKVVTAHNLFEYKNSFHSIKLSKSSGTLLDHLLKIDEREEL